MKNINQLLFDFKFNKNYLDNDYYLSTSNQEAYNLIDRWPQWIKKTMNLYGEKFSGKSHLASIFEKKTTCIKIFSEEFSNKTIQNFKTKQALIIEDLNMFKLIFLAFFLYFRLFNVNILLYRNRFYNLFIKKEII